jgi:hypothetical protein
MKLIMLSVFLVCFGCVNAHKDATAPRIFHSSNIETKLTIISASETSIHYAFQSGGKCGTTGTATRDASVSDPEIDLDENGLGYPSYEYASGEECLVTMRVKISFNPRIVVGDRVVLTFYKCTRDKKSCEKTSTDVLFAAN